MSMWGEEGEMWYGGGGGRDVSMWGEEGEM